MKAPNTFESIDLEAFLGDSVEKFMTDKSFSHYEDFQYLTESDEYTLNGLVIKYPNKEYILLYFEDLKYTEEYKEDYSWNYETVKKEMIVQIEIFHTRNHSETLIQKKILK
jgi:hypothetical protein